MSDVMGLIEHGEGPGAMVRDINWSTTRGRMQGRARLCEAGEEIIALRQQLAGAVSAAETVLRVWQGYRHIGTGDADMDDALDALASILTEASSR